MPPSVLQHHHLGASSEQDRIIWALDKPSFSWLLFIRQPPASSENPLCLSKSCVEIGGQEFKKI